MNLNTAISHATVLFGILGFIYTAIRLYRNKYEIKLETLLVGAFTGSTIPTGIILIWSAFNPSIIQQLEGINIHIAAAGLALLYIAYRWLFIDPQI